MKTGNSIEIKIYPRQEQARGSFDNGRITETTPIGFPQDGPRVAHTGPLFYWAWATAAGHGKIALHPHQAFEIVSYVLEGEIGHHDTLGNRSRVKAGGAQVMQTGSGVSHQEETLGERTEFFQIWFEPNLRQAILKEPTYRDVRNEDFPVEQHPGFTIKRLIGDGAPVKLVADAAMQDVAIAPGGEYHRRLAAGRTLAVVAVSGKGGLMEAQSDRDHGLRTGDFAVLHARVTSSVILKAESKSALRLAIIEVPAQADYPLYREGIKMQ